MKSKYSYTLMLFIFSDAILCQACSFPPHSIPFRNLQLTESSLQKILHRAPSSRMNFCVEHSGRKILLRLPPHIILLSNILTRQQRGVLRPIDKTCILKKTYTAQSHAAACRTSEEIPTWFPAFKKALKFLSPLCASNNAHSFELLHSVVALSHGRGNGGK